MKRLGVRICEVTLLVLTVLPGLSRAASTSVFRINATNGPIDSFTGTGIRIGQIELGVPDTNNLLLAGRVVLTTNLSAGTSGGIDDHPTSVAGTMIATGALARGIAPGATVYSVQVTNFGGASPYLDFVTNFVNAGYFLATQQNVRVINMSMSLGGTEGKAIGTSVWERAIDRLVAQTGVTFVQTAGNSGTLGANSLREAGGAFNSIVVGAVNNAKVDSSTNVAFYSPQGYLSDGRSKPDILAPGGRGSGSDFSDNLIMPTTNNPAAPVGPHYATTTNVAGTSFAAPQVAAVVARLLEAGSGGFANTNAAASQDPRVIKAGLLNAATKLPGWAQQNTTTNGGTILVDHPLDASQGAGLMNANKSLLQLQAGRYAPTVAGADPPGSAVPLKGWDLFSVSLSLTNVYRLNASAAGEMRLTLDWYRDIGPTIGGTNEDWGLANLDLYLWRSPDSAFTNLTAVGKSISTVDNLEHLYFTDLTVGWYQFGVSYTNYFQTIDATPLGVVYGLAWDFTIPEPGTWLLVVLGLTIVCRLQGRRTRGS